MKALIKRCKKESGQGLVEFALLLPLLLLLVLGMLEYGWLLNAKLTVNSAAKEAARTMVVFEVSGADKAAKANVIVTNILGSGFTIETNPGTLPSSGEQFTVTVKDTVTPLVGLFVKGPQPVEGTATMRME